MVPVGLVFVVEIVVRILLVAAVVVVLRIVQKEKAALDRGSAKRRDGQDGLRVEHGLTSAKWDVKSAGKKEDETRRSLQRLLSCVGSTQDLLEGVQTLKPQVSKDVRMKSIALIETEVLDEGRVELETSEVVCSRQLHDEL